MKESGKKPQTNAAVYGEEARRTLDAFIEAHFGPYQTLEKEPEEPVDILLAAPASQREFYTLLTRGMGARPMNIPAQWQDDGLEHAELAICLPPDWNVQEDGWPVRLLRRLAHFPFEEDTWLGWGHTVPEPAAGGFCASLLAEPAAFFAQGEAPVCSLPDGKTVNFYQVIPLYEEELAYKTAHDAESLLDKLGEAARIADTKRANACPSAAPPSSFRERACAFEDWFSHHEEKLAAACADRKLAAGKEMASLLAQGAQKLGGGVTLSLTGRRSLTLDPGTDDTWLYLLPWLTARLQEKNREWRFHAGKPGSRGRDYTVERETLLLDASEVLASLSYQADTNRFTISFYHDSLCNRTEEEALDAFRELLAHMLGDMTAYIYEGRLCRAEERKRGMRPLTELQEALAGALEAEGRELYSRADQQMAVYDFEPQENEELRFDILVGSTCYAGLNEDYYADNPARAQRLAGRGARACFLAFAYDGEMEPMLAVRHELEERLENEVLGLRGSGRSAGLVLGGAVGTQCVYVDLLLYDEAAFREAARPVLGAYPYDFYLSDFRQRCDLEALS